MAFPIKLAASTKTIRTVDMHTTGEPARIVFEGYPDLQGTLLQQRAEAQINHDHIRRRLLLEPRGHRDMYGAILRPLTEFTRNKTAHMGVLFLTNEGYSMMCGHATIALGRFLVDCHDLKVFPKRDELKLDTAARTVKLILHAPSGLLDLTIPTSEHGTLSDPSRPVTFLNVESFAVGLDLKLSVPQSFAWPELPSPRNLTVDLSYGGAFFCIVTAFELGFPDGLQSMSQERISAFDYATKRLKAYLQADPTISKLIRHPEHDELGLLYSVLVTDDTSSPSDPAVAGSETGICFFGDQGIDRSPTGSGVAARVALAAAKGARKPHQKWIYHSLVSRAFGDGGFTGSIVKQVSIDSVDERGKVDAVVVAIEGSAYYTGFHEFIVEDKDPLKISFLFDRLSGDDVV